MLYATAVRIILRKELLAPCSICGCSKYLSYVHKDTPGVHSSNDLQSDGKMEQVHKFLNYLRTMEDRGLLSVILSHISDTM